MAAVYCTVKRTQGCPSEFIYVVLRQADQLRSHAAKGDVVLSLVLKYLLCTEVGNWPVGEDLLVNLAVGVEVTRWSVIKDHQIETSGSRRI